jgi:molybdate transport system substrate-binding protein
MRTIWAILLVLGVCCASYADEITVAAASDLQFAMKDVAARFEKQTGNTVKLSFGSSGNFYSQIENGAPFDLFFSADMEYPKKLAEAGLVEPGSLYQYATGRIVLWVAKSSSLNVERGLDILLDSGVKKIAIANPAHAPYGRAAVAAMENAHVYDKVRGKLVFGENISQTAHFVESGNADVGILALSLSLASPLKEEGEYFVIPADLYPPLSQGVIILKSSHKKKAARQFLDFLKSKEVVGLLKQYGFESGAANSAKRNDQ